MFPSLRILVEACELGAPETQILGHIGGEILIGGIRKPLTLKEQQALDDEFFHVVVHVEVILGPRTGLAYRAIGFGERWPEFSEAGPQQQISAICPTASWEVSQPAGPSPEQAARPLRP